MKKKYKLQRIKDLKNGTKLEYREYFIIFKTKLDQCYNKFSDLKLSVLFSLIIM